MGSAYIFKKNLLLKPRRNDKESTESTNKKSQDNHKSVASLNKAMGDLEIKMSKVPGDSDEYAALTEQYLDLMIELENIL